MSRRIPHKPLISAPDGRFVTEPLPRDAGYSISIRPNGWVPASMSFHIAEDAQDPIELEPLVLTPTSARLEGFVVHETDEPVRNAEVLLNIGSGGKPWVWSTRTDEHGRFALSNLWDSNLRSEVSSPSHTRTNLPPGTTNVVVRIKIQ